MIFAVEIAFQAVSHGFVQQNSGPAGTKDNIHDTGRGGLRTQIDKCYAQRLVDLCLPIGRLDQAGQRNAAATSGSAAFAARR